MKAINFRAMEINPGNAPTFKFSFIGSRFIHGDISSVMESWSIMEDNPDIRYAVVVDIMDNKDYEENDEVEGGECLETTADLFYINVDKHTSN